MKKITAFFVFIGLLASTSTVFAQGMMGGQWGMMGQNYYGTQQNVDTAGTAQDEAKGKAIWDKLQAKQTECKNLTDDDFDVLGDYFMGIMVGNSHASMNDRMTQAMGDQGEKQMHIVMGKRFSGCDSAAVLSPQYQGFSYMMPMMGGYNQYYPMMNGGFGYHNASWSMMGQYAFPLFHIVCGISLILGWTVLVFVILALASYIKESKRK